MKRFVIDCDAVQDDLFALLLALRHPEASVEAVTVVAGDAPLTQGVTNILRTLNVAGATDVPVYAGCDRPLTCELVTGEFVHGQDGMGDMEIEEFLAVSGEAEAEHGAVALTRLFAAPEHPTSILAIGPMTNLALAVRLDPTLPERVEHVYVMGGTNNGMGNSTPAASYNLYADPEAARIVVQAGFNLTLIPLPVVRDAAVFGPDHLEKIGQLDSKLSRFFLAANRRTYEWCTTRESLAGATHPDTLTCAIAIDETLIREESHYYVDIETRGELTRGASLMDWFGTYEQPPNARIIDAVDEDRFFNMVLAALAT